MHLARHRADSCLAGSHPLQPQAEAVVERISSTVQALLNAGARVDVQDSEGRTAVHWAAFVTQPGCSILRLLLERGANIAIPDRSGRTPLHVAAARGMTEAIEILLEANADPMAPDLLLYTPYDWATRNDHQDTAVVIRKKMISLRLQQQTAST